VCVPDDTISLAAHHQCELRVSLEANHAIHDVNTDVLQTLRPFDVPLFVESGLQFHQRNNLFACLGGLDERPHDRAVLGGSIQGHLDG